MTLQDYLNLIRGINISFGADYAFHPSVEGGIALCRFPDRKLGARKGIEFRPPDLTPLEHQFRSDWIFPSAKEAEIPSFARVLHRAMFHPGERVTTILFTHDAPPWTVDDLFQLKVQLCHYFDVGDLPPVNRLSCYDCGIALSGGAKWE